MQRNRSLVSDHSGSTQGGASRPLCRAAMPLTRLLGVWIAIASGAVVHAQVTTDGSTGSLGAGGVTGGVDSGGATVDFLVTEDYGDRAGGNFFVGLSSLDVASGEIASFDPLANDPLSGAATQLILARINSADPSRIDGVLRSPLAGVHLMILNPSGVIFGADAQLDLAGSFTATSADELRWDDPQGGQAIVPTRSSDPVQLSSALPSAFGFFDAPAAVTVDVGRLEVPATLPGETPHVLRLVGGSVEVTSSAGSRFLRARGGRIEIAAVPGNQVVPIDVGQIDPAIFRDAPGAEVSLSGDSLQFSLDVGSDVAGSQAPGTLVIRGGRVVVDRARLRAENFGAFDAPATAGIDVRGGSVEMIGGALALTSNYGTGSGANILIGADSISLSGGAFVEAETTASGLGGSLRIEGLEAGTRAEQVRLTGGALLLTESSSTGPAGSIDLDSDLLSMDGLNTGILSGTSGPGFGGAVRVRADVVSLIDAAQLGTATTGDGNAGMIEIIADTRIYLEGRRPGRPTAILASSGTVPGAPVGLGDAGSIRLEAPTIQLENGAEITARSLGSGAAGAVTLEGVDRLLVRGGALGASSIGVATRDGLSGNMTVNAANVELIDGGFLTVGTIGDADAGRLVVNAERVLIAGRDPLANGEAGLRATTISPAGSAGRGGEIEIRGARSIDLRSGGEIRATSSGPGDAGTIRISGARRLTLSDGAAIRTSAAASQGGDISIETTDWVVLQSGSEITTRVETGSRSGGNIALGTRVLALENAQIDADADEGPGGNVDIDAQLLVRAGSVPGTPGMVSSITATSNVGIDGVVEISTPEADLIGGLAPLAEEGLVADPLRASPCDVTDSRSRRSHLIIADPDGLPPGPTGWLPSWAGKYQAPPNPSAPGGPSACKRPVRDA